MSAAKRQRARLSPDRLRELQDAVQRAPLRSRERRFARRVYERALRIAYENARNPQ